MNAVPSVQALQRTNAVPIALLAPNLLTAKTQGSSKIMVQTLDNVVMLPNSPLLSPTSSSNPKVLAFPSYLNLGRNIFEDQ